MLTLFTLLLGIAGVTSMTCPASDYHIYWGDPSSDRSYHSEMTGVCHNGSHCGSYRYEGSYLMSSMERSNFSTSVETCFVTDSCMQFSGATDGSACKKAQWEWQYVEPTSCDVNQDYDRSLTDHTLELSYYCCSFDNCTEDYHYSDCPVDDDLSNYMSDLYDCWNEVQFDFLMHGRCDNDGKDYEFVSMCRDNEHVYQQDIQDMYCEYKKTCSPELQEYLLQFAQCSCNVATTYGIYEDEINTWMKSLWRDYCPGAEIKCNMTNDESPYALRRVKYRAGYEARVDITRDELHELIDEIREGTARDLNIGIDYVTVKDFHDLSAGYRRRLLAASVLQIQLHVETFRDMEYFAELLRGYGEAVVYDSTGIIVSQEFFANFIDNDDITEVITTTPFVPTTTIVETTTKRPRPETSEEDISSRMMLASLLWVGVTVHALFMLT